MGKLHWDDPQTWNAYGRDWRHARQLGVTVAFYRMAYRVQLVCCGQWWPVETLPHVCPVCGRRYLERKRA